tara:strand:- start:632 stop:1108 length:477 start_codon:yes stop_codon:yes gene_type:complete
MNIFLSRKSLYLVILGYSIFAIIYALYIEYYLNYQPCKLCLYQRVPFILAIFVSFVGFNFPKKDEVLILLITTFAVGMIISGYHFGIENNIFEEFKGCSNNSLNITDKADLLKSLNQTLPSCKDISFTLFGISLAGLNFLSSLLILIYSVRTLVYEKN